MSPLSRDPEKRSKQLGNLRAGAGQAGVGNIRSLKHGVYARISERDLDGKAREIYGAISADAPVRASDGSLPAHDGIAVRLLAETLIRRERVAAEELAHGIEIASGPRKGELRGIVQYGLRLDQQTIDLLDRLGMTPRARAALGLDLARATRFDLAQQWAAAESEDDLIEIEVGDEV